MEQVQRIRNMWQFANLCQWIYIFGDAASIDNSVDVECIEAECLKPNSTILNDVALALLKMVSSQRGLTHASFDDQARRQYILKSPDSNPFGNEDEPKGFADLDIFTKIRVMQQFTQWIMIRPELLREKMKEQKDTEQTTWRIEPYGWDSEDRTYYVLDDNRVYRLSEAPPSQKAASSKPTRQPRRSGKRRRISEAIDDDTTLVSNGPEADLEDSHLGGMVWECVAVTLEEVQALVNSMASSRDENEKILRRQLRDHLVPILEKQEEDRNRRKLKREKELQTLAKLANAKRSSRIAMKAEQRQQEEHAKIEQEQLREAAAIQQREEQKREKVQRELEMRLVSREQRLKKREERRHVRGESGTPASVDEGSEAAAPDGMSQQPQTQLEIGANPLSTKEKQEEEEGWVFDCSCGLYGQVDDGNHSVACERCNVWQHSKCLGISEAAADHPDFHFICASCRQKGTHDVAPKSLSPPKIEAKLGVEQTTETSAVNLEPAAVKIEPPVISVGTNAVNIKPIVVDTEPAAAAIHTEPVAAITPKPAAPIHTTPIATITPKPVANITTEPAATAHNEHVDAIHPEPASINSEHRPIGTGSI
ncbi:PHD-finger domain-containing protein [Trichoderma breve]|uniref:PHD-finger domain-containing protein n=1 Tax=Trichoderma breve TaxID=2034170 RepID=A0A9W9E9N1_9HYPO|nr:PHD-finger domain-containing protein [Trichoderma breve]KAJ4860136.1 PHD-finger domain-containing protein [Trichoderma breve]